MGIDADALVRLWQEKRGEIEPEDLSGNLIVQLGVVTEDLNRCWYEANAGAVVTDIQKRVRHPAVRWLGATFGRRIPRRFTVPFCRGHHREVHRHADEAAWW